MAAVLLFVAALIPAGKTELAEEVDVTVVNLSALKNGRARAIRFSTLTALCEALDCQPGDLLEYG